MFGGRQVPSGRGIAGFAELVYCEHWIHDEGDLNACKITG